MASQSLLARQVLHLLESEEHADLEFVLPADPETNQAGHVVKAHRVVLAARCRWFYRALLSGMREAIDRLAINLFFSNLFRIIAKWGSFPYFYIIFFM